MIEVIFEGATANWSRYLLGVIDTQILTISFRGEVSWILQKPSCGRSPAGLFLNSDCMPKITHQLLLSVTQLHFLLRSLSN